MTDLGREGDGRDHSSGKTMVSSFSRPVSNSIVDQKRVDS